MWKLRDHIIEATWNNKTRTVRMSVVLSNPTKGDAQKLLDLIWDGLIEVNPGTHALLESAKQYGWQNAREQIHLEIRGHAQADRFEMEIPGLAQRYMLLFVSEIDGNVWIGKVLANDGEWEFLATVSKAGDKVLSVEADTTLPKLVEQFIRGYLLK